jgi:hypothetical protein|tara:strand:- start:2636 stop:2986 length:351 start_codon:yes stop_codon:yes gene_type:complete
MAETLIPQTVAVNPVNGARLRLGHSVATLSDAIVLLPQSAQFQALDPDGVHRNVDLPAEEASLGLFFFIKNTAGGAENLVVRDDAGSTKETLGQGKWGIFFCDGTSWETMGVLSHA